MFKVKFSHFRFFATTNIYSLELISKPFIREEKIKKITSDKVKEAVNKLLERKELVSARSIRDEIGFGSFSTISKYLKEISEKGDFSGDYDTKTYISQTLENISSQTQALSQLINPSVKSPRNDSPIFLLIYKSKIGPDFKGKKSLKEIETTSIRNNTKHAISGLLLFCEDQFLQMIEGDPYELVKLYQAIIQDARNKENKLLWFFQIKERIFPDWAMLTSEVPPELFSQCVKLASNTKNRGTKSLVNSLDWLAQFAHEYHVF